MLYEVITAEIGGLERGAAAREDAGVRRRGGNRGGDETDTDHFLPFFAVFFALAGLAAGSALS